MGHVAAALPPSKMTIRAVVCLTRGLSLEVGPAHPQPTIAGPAGPWGRPELLNRANCLSCRRTAQLHSPNSNRAPGPQPPITKRLAPSDPSRSENSLAALRTLPAGAPAP